VSQISVLIAFACLGVVPVTAQNAPPPGGQAPSNDDLYQMGKQLFDQYAPPEVKEQYEFPTKAQFDDFMARLDRALDEGSLSDLAGYEPQARAALVALRAIPDQADLADWLSSRLDEIDEAGKISGGGGEPVSPRSPATAGTPPARPGAAPPPNLGPAGPVGRPATLAARIPYYDRWLARERASPEPANASALMPRLRRDFSAEGVPPEIAWLAEAESSLNPSARSPSGARGLFQLKADTAHDLGLSTFLPDDRADPDKSARAAAQYLRGLGRQFGSWPLAFAAYNAGSGRVRRLLEERHASDYAGIADGLPAGTRMYVPKVCALIAVRAGVPPQLIQKPDSR
jgi:membrane-bound lytic murein transglycosylase D